MLADHFGAAVMREGLESGVAAPIDTYSALARRVSVDASSAVEIDREIPAPTLNDPAIRAQAPIGATPFWERSLS